MIAVLLFTLAGALPLATAHIALFHPSMYGFNVTMQTYSYDNRPVAPLMDYTFEQWWFHGHLDHPPNEGDFFELPAGKPATAELACDKGATSYFASSPGGDVRQGNNPCPSSDGSFPSGAMHTNGFDDLTGCALAIAYESDVTKIKPEDFTVFSVNQTCVWNRFTDFQVPKRMPPCPPGGCHCAWFWIHSPDSGGEQNYMNGFKCNITGSTSNVALAKPELPRRCGADSRFEKKEAALGNCTYGAKQPFYWFQKERNNMFEGTYAPPFYTDLYNFKDGAQNDIFVDSYPRGLPAPTPNSSFVPTPNLAGGDASVAGGSTSSPVYSSISSSSSAETTSTVTSSMDVSASASASSFSASTLSISTTSSAMASSISPPSLPLSTASGSVSFITSASQSSGATSMLSTPETGTVESTSVVVSTSVVLSTVVVTVTAAPAPVSTTTGVVQPTSTGESTFSSFSFQSTASDSIIVSTAVSSTFMATQAPATTAPLTNTNIESTTAKAPPTITLNFPTSIPTAPVAALSADVLISSNDTNDGGQTVSLTDKAKDFTMIRTHPGLLASVTSSSDPLCKRQVGRKVFRRRVTNSKSSQQSASEPSEPKDLEDWTMFSRISIPGLRRHRKLQNRSRLWSII